MPSPDFRQDSFTHVLVGDVVAANTRLEADDTPVHRRELIRTTFAAIEGLHWQLKRDVLRHAEVVTNLSAHEYAALMEESYSVNENGTVRSQPRFMPLPTAIRLVVSIVQRYRTEYQLDYQHVGWSNLRAAVEVRNRLVHPKTLEELTVSDGEVSQALSAFNWLLALVIEVLRETHAHMQAITSGFLKKAAQSDAADANPTPTTRFLAHSDANVRLDFPGTRMSPDPETGKYIMQNIIQTLLIGSLWLMALPTQATDISSQPPQAASESAPAQQDEWLTTYRDLFTNGKSARDMEVFIATYKDTDPEKRVPRAMIRLRTFTAFEAAIKARQCRRAQILHRRITGYKVTLPFSYAACRQGPTAQPTDPAELYVAGVRFEDDGEYANARTLFRAILDRDPRHPIAIQAAERLARMAEIEQLGSSGKQTPPVKPTTALSSPTQPAIPAVRLKAAACPKNLEYIRRNMVFVELRNNPSFAEPIEGIIHKAGGLDAAIAELERLIRENQRPINQAQFTLKQYKRADDQTDNLAFRCAQPNGDFCSANYFYHLLKEGDFYYTELLNSLRCRKTGVMEHAVYAPAPIKRP